MKINLTNLLNQAENNKKFSYSLDMCDLSYCGYNPIKTPVKVDGKIFSKADIVCLDMKIQYTFDGQCDRCAEDVKKDFTINVNKIIVEELQNEDDDENYIVVNNQELNVDDLVREEVALNLPSKILCTEDCKGICQKCGANLNVNECNCKPDVDPRMSALLQLLDEE